MRAGRSAGGTVVAALAVVAFAAASAPAANASFPYSPAAPGSTEFKDYRLPSGSGKAPNDLTGNLEWMYSATPEANNVPVNNDPKELGGVRGARLVDNADVDTAWRTSTGRPDVGIAVVDSGIKWNDRSAMLDLRRKLRLNRGELPKPAHDRGQPLEPLPAGETCGSLASAYDANRDGVFNVSDYACDARVEIDPDARAARGQPRGVGPGDLLDPQDVLIAFTNGDDADRNGFKDDIVGWDFLDNDNDAYDDVQYGHGTGEARDSTAEADNGGSLGTCPNCMSIPLRVGDSFVADESRFAQAAIYATDNDISVIQEALGTLNHSQLARRAIDYAYDSGVTVVASAADEAAQHHNWPSSNPRVIMVNSVTRYDEFTQVPKSYLQFNGCTNFYSKLTVSIPSVSCSSDATGRGSGMAGLIYSTALNARERGTISDHPSCKRTNGERCAISPNEVRQAMASGTVDGAQQADDVNFADAEGSCAPVALPTCTDPNLNSVNANRLVAPFPATVRYPARKGFDMFYGYGRVNMNRALDAVDAGKLPPEAEITSPGWYDQIDPARGAVEIRGQVGPRSGGYRCRLLVAPGSQPNNAEVPGGDFKPVGSGQCNGDARNGRFDGVLGAVDIAELKRRFPPTAGSFDGRESGGAGQTSNGRPNSEPYGFTVKVLVTAAGSPALTGEDRRNLYLHRDQDLLDGFPKKLPSDGEASPLLVDLDGDNRNELVVATSDGTVHAYRRDGSELPGWPVRSDPLPLHTGGRAFASGAIPAGTSNGAIIASPAAADLNKDGRPEVVAADFLGKVYVWSASGKREFTRESNPAYSGKPLTPFADVRKGKRNRTQHGFFGSPVLADLDRKDGGKLEVIAAAMDRHVYAWRSDGTPVKGFPTIVVDRSKVSSIDPKTHAVSFNGSAGDELDQGAIVDTPAIGDITGDDRPEIVVGTNEEYKADSDGGLNAGLFNSASLSVLGQSGLLSLANGRLHAIKPDGDPDGDLLSGASPYVDGWPFKVARLNAELLPVVGEGITGSPVIGVVDCLSGGKGAKVGTIPDGGVGYVLNPDAKSCIGQAGGKDIGMQSDVPASVVQDVPLFPAVGQPAFGKIGAGGETTFLAPAAGLRRALDLAVKEYQQGGQDFLAAWDPKTGQLKPGWPAVVNDLQFLTGPSIADIDGKPGEETLEGSASLDLQALTGSGQSLNGKWPKLTSDWMVANPLIGSFGQRETAGDTRKAVVAITRSGSIFAYRTAAPPCSAASWPRFHHDNANSGDARRDAVSPGRVEGLSLAGGRLSFRAPGDDLLCGKAARYEVVTSERPITGANFRRARQVAGAPEPGAPGTEQVAAVAAGAGRFIGIRAVDEQGNVGPAAVISTAAGSGGGAGSGSAPPGVRPSAGGRLILGTRGDDRLRGTPGNDVIICSSGDDHVIAGAGDDYIDCGAGDDRINAGSGNDVVLGRSGADFIRAASGRDRLSGGSGPDRIGGGSGRDAVLGGSGRDRIVGNSGADRVSGGSGRDRIVGGSDRDRLSGGSGNDRLAGGRGRDRLSGGPGRDRLFGGSGNDRLFGGPGRDRLFGGPGRDFLFGGPGRDFLFGGSGNDRLFGGPGRDRVSQR